MTPLAKRLMLTSGEKASTALASWSSWLSRQEGHESIKARVAKARVLVFDALEELNAVEATPIPSRMDPDDIPPPRAELERLEKGDA